MFKSKPIKRGGKIPFQQFRNIHSNFQIQISSQISNNNNYATAPAFLNPYVSKKLNNMDKAQVIKKEREDWMKLYYKILKGLETIIDVQRMVKDIKKIAKEVNTIIIEMKRTILMASINNRTTNTMNITGISEDLQYIVQSDIKD